MNEPDSKRCPICGKPIEASASRSASDHAPFCSSRCKDRDLARWFGDAYAVPGPPASNEDIERALREEDR